MTSSKLSISLNQFGIVQTIISRDAPQTNTADVAKIPSAYSLKLLAMRDKLRRFAIAKNVCKKNDNKLLTLILCLLVN